MRITGGEKRGRRLASFKGSRIRPTSDRVREAIFNLLGQQMRGYRVLDLFAGTGALGIEAISRGARDAVFVDHSPEALQLIRKNLSLCGYEGRARLLRRDLSKGLRGDLLGEGWVRAGLRRPPLRERVTPPLAAWDLRPGDPLPGGLICGRIPQGGVPPGKRGKALPGQGAGLRRQPECSSTPEAEVGA